jgi:hypothetical protein
MAEIENAVRGHERDGWILRWLDQIRPPSCLTGETSDPRAGESPGWAMWYCREPSQSLMKRDSLAAQLFRTCRHGQLPLARRQSHKERPRPGLRVKGLHASRATCERESPPSCLPSRPLHNLVTTLSVKVSKVPGLSQPTR